jgi:anti-sigma B factor antagonist
MNYFTVKDRQVKDVIVLDICGQIKGCGGRGILHDAIFQKLKQGHRQFILNLARVSSIDSSCLGELVSSYLYLENNGGKMGFIRLSQRVRELLEITNLITTFAIYENEVDALDSFLYNTLDPAKQSLIFLPKDSNPLS